MDADHQPRAASRITHVVRWENGMVMVFDQHGQQMPDYQGPWEEMRDKILADKPAGVTIEGPYAWR